MKSAEDAITSCLASWLPKWADVKSKIQVSCAKANEVRLADKVKLFLFCESKNAWHWLSQFEKTTGIK